MFKNRLSKTLAISMIIVFAAGWLLFSYYRYTNQILIIAIEGSIVDFSETTMALYNAMVNNNVKSVILFLNTPGGLAYPCLEIASYVEELAQRKPVIAVMGAECASGGYYIASFATYIYARAHSITGGIGVIYVWVDLSEYYEKQGIKIWLWKTGAEKDLGAEWRSPTQEENATIQETVNTLFTKLITDIQNNRDLPEDVVNDVITGEVYLGSLAVEMGLADSIGNIFNAEKKAIEMTGLWRYIIVNQEMDDLYRFLKALF